MLVSKIKHSLETHTNIQGYRHMHKWFTYKLEPFRDVLCLHINSNSREPILEDNSHQNNTKRVNYTYAICRALD